MYRLSSYPCDRPGVIEGDDGLTYFIDRKPRLTELLNATKPRSAGGEGAQRAWVEHVDDDTQDETLIAEACVEGATVVVTTYPGWRTL